MAKRLFMLSILIVINTACSITRDIDELAVVVSAQNGSDFMVGAVQFDDSWSAPAGSVGCCWKDGGKMSFTYDIPFPKKVEVAWYDMDTDLFRVGEATIDNKAGYEFIQDLKPFINRRTGQYKDRKLPYLIVGMKRNGLIKVWISNAPADVLGRQILEIGSGMAQIKELPPEDER
ncbi:DUF2931 domain-containing protein [Pseudoalteromonas umbrosa]|uniref:DUF2931 domain-containing protein n=1 Tax=Pseudoalteromonas umbrosa TaxID=3048489 RepID=UPI0024C3B0F8|nr:DUF2931 domain-containing protein [Pseudoalteromonas sp. B95]MDK1287607.1 DUF2931 domain-containing protein [Pseudoalteromonas sp. B95]